LLDTYRNLALAEAESRAAQEAADVRPGSASQGERDDSSPVHPPSPDTHSEALPSHLKALRVRTTAEEEPSGEEADDGSGLQYLNVTPHPPSRTS